MFASRWTFSIWKIGKEDRRQKKCEGLCFPWYCRLWKLKSCHLLKGWPWILTIYSHEPSDQSWNESKKPTIYGSIHFGMKIFLWLNERKWVWESVYVNLVYVSTEFPEIFQDMVHPPTFYVCLTSWVPIHAAASLLSSSFAI